MRIPLSVILDELKYQHTVHVDELENPEFEWVHLLIPKNSQPSKQYLQICTLTEALDYSLQQKGLYYLCLRDRLVDDRETEEALHGMIIINENVDLRQLFNDIQAIFFKINNWVMQMQQSIVDNKGYQHLFDLSEDIIKTHMHLLDPTFKLLAYTKNYETDDEVSGELIRNGYHSEKNVKIIQSAGRFELYKKQDDIIINKNRTVAKYITLERAFSYNNDYTVQAVLLFEYREFSRGVIDLFRIFTNYIKVYVDRKYAQSAYTPYDSLVYDLIEGNIKNEKAIMDRANNVRIPYQSNFNLYIISFSDCTNVPASRIMQETANILTSSKVIVYKETIVSLNIYNGKNIEEISNKNISKLQHLLKEYNASCGISNHFKCLLDLQTAYKQAAIAIYLRKKMANIENVSGLTPWIEFNDGWVEVNNRIIKFEDCYIYYMMDKCITENPQIFETCFANEALKTIQEYDRKHNLEYMRILKTYLMCESRASQAANVLHMHRNNVIYHINKIKNLIQTDLEDPEVRIKLLVGFKTFELYNSQNIS